MIIVPRTRENHDYYGSASATPREILSGAVGLSPPKAEVEYLHGVIAKAAAGAEAWGLTIQSEFQLFVSGRVCLFGEHSDWAGGYRVQNHDIVPGATIVCGTEHEGLYATVKKRSDHKLVLRSVLDDGQARPSLPTRVPQPPSPLSLSLLWPKRFAAWSSARAAALCADSFDSPPLPTPLPRTAARH